MTELLPCPHCGSDDVGPITFKGCNGDVWDEFIVCGGCGATAETVEAWNSRAERTCECVAEYAKSPIDGKTIVLHRCSACHELMRPHMLYCPNCGARVISKTENVLQSSEGVER